MATTVNYAQRLLPLHFRLWVYKPPPPTAREKSHNPSGGEERKTLLPISGLGRSLPATIMASELACTYAALILHDDGIPITAEKIATLVKAANVSVESYWPSLFAKLLEKRSVDDLITNVGSGGGGAAVAVAAPAAGGAAAAAAPAAAEEKKEEPKEESDDDMGFSLFD